jgi:hypothetical protein
MRQHILAPKIHYELEAEFEDDTTEREERLTFQELEAYLRKCLFHLRHRALHAEGENKIGVRITLTAINPTKGQ